MKHKTAKANVKTRTRLLSLLLAVLMTLFCFPVTAIVNGETNGESASEMSDSVQNIGLSEQTNGLSELTDVPKIALNGMSEEDGEPVRLPLLEKDLYTIAYTDTSGQCKMKMFSYPVKYVDADGKIKDISLEIEQDENGGFRTAANNIITKFPQKLTDGISLEYDDIKIEMIPIEKTDGKISTEKIGAFNAMLSADNKKVSYTFGSKTRLDYELTYTGFKEDIVVESYTGQTEYNFFIKTNGLTLTERSGSYFIEDSDGNVKATIGDIIIFTADERNNTFGSMTHTVIKENQIYAMTVHVDSEFLKDEKTAYPIRIDPTVEINYDSNGAGAIEDYTVNTVDTLSGSSGSVCLGKYASDGSVSRILMRIPNFNFAQYTQNQIVNVSVNIRDLKPGTAEAVVSCYRFTGNAWSESSSVSWNGVNANAYSDLQDTKTVSYASGNAQPTTYWYSFNITNAAKQWAAGTADQSKGIIFKAADTTESGSAHVYKTFASYNRASYKPTVTVEYQYIPGAISFPTSYIEIPEGGTASLNTVVTPSHLTVTYSSQDLSVATVDTNGTVTGKKAGVTLISASTMDDNGDPHIAYCTVYTYIPNGIYKFKSAASNFYIEVPQGSISDNTVLIQWVTENNRNSRFKLHYLGYGQYSIRSMLKSDMGLENLDNELVNSYIGASDNAADLASTSIWIIKGESNGYYIENLYNSKVITSPSSSSYGYNYTLSVSTYQQTNLQLWNFEKLNYSANGVEIRDKTFKLAVGDNYHFIAAMYSSIDKVNGQHGITWSLTNGSGSANINARTGLLSGISAGTVTVTAKYNYYDWYDTCTVEIIPIKEGSYLFKNKETTKYMQPDNDGNAHMEQHEFDSSAKQRWQMIHHSGTYYYIVNNDTGKYLTAPDNNTDGASISEANYSSTIQSRQLWSVSNTSDQTSYKIQSMNQIESNLVLAVGWGANWNGVNIEQRNFTSDSNNKDEWILCIWFEHGINVSVVYDSAYNNRYSDVYSRISIQVLTLQKKYLNEFGIEVNDISISPFSSYADIHCSLSYGDECNHADDALCKNSVLYTNGSTNLKEYHHTNIYNIMLRIPFPDISASVKVAYIGHELCTEDNHSGHPFYGLTYSSIGLATVMNFYSETSETKTFIHEFGHFYGVIDHYGGSVQSTNQIIATTGNTGYNKNCIYGENKETPSVLNNFKICDGCKSIIESNIDLYNH